MMPRTPHLFLLMVSIAACSAHGPREQQGFGEGGDASAPSPAAPSAPPTMHCGDAGLSDSLTMLADAPSGTGDQHLGRPLNGEFHFLTGAPGASLFPGASVRTTPVNKMEHRYVFADDSLKLAANASGWGVSVDVGKDSSRRYAAYQAYQIKEVHEIDDTAALRTSPEGAYFFPWRIHYGFSYEVVVSGDQSEFHAGVKASFLAFSGSVSTFAKENNLTVTAIGRGLTPKSGDAIFAHDAAAIEHNYSASGPAVPIFIEYRSIPGACPPKADLLEWLQPINVDLNFSKIDVYRNGADGNWALGAKCYVNNKERFLEHPAIWGNHGGTLEDCVTGPPGPSNKDTTYCTYNLAWGVRMQLLAGDKLRCGIDGMVIGNVRQVPYSEFEIEILPKNNVAISSRIGAWQDKVEYWAYYTLAFSTPP